MSKVIITGVPGKWQQGVIPPPRLEIHDLIKDSRQFSLYVQALAALQADPESDVVSHYQMAGIHGLPYVEWDGSGGPQPVPGSGWSGYCTHGSVLFPTWHRPYVALYEQVLQAHAVQIAGKYTTSDKAQYQAAAANLRAPYWDWAANAVPPAEVISKTSLTVTGPNGQPLTVNPNPLYGYNFRGGANNFPAPYSVWKKTLRHATNDTASAVNNVQELISTLQSSQEDITTSTYNMLTRVTTWPAFSNHTPGDGGSTSNSLEAIHDGIHVDVGGDGFMSDPSVAGHDPIFFLHHCNVDRMLALWQAINPGVNVTPGSSEDGNWTIKANTQVDATTALTPFWNSAQGYWNSTQTPKFQDLGYIYPEFQGLNLSDTQAVRVAIAQKVNQLYGGQTVTLPVEPPTRGPGPVPAPAPGPQPGGGAQHPIPPTLPGGTIAHKGEIADWTARVRCKKYEVGSSFSVYLFIGQVPEDPKHWRTCPSLVGAHKAFVNSVAERCENCKNQADVYTEGFVHLDYALVKQPVIKSLDVETVEPYLKQNLHWRVQKANGQVVSDLKSLEVDVISTHLQYKQGDIFPHARGGPTHHHEITAGRHGGHPA
jgi:tyrosinase